MSAPLHTILGATGVIGRETSRALPETVRIRQVSRTPERVRPTDDLHPADLTDERAVDAAVAGSEVVYLCAGLKYDITVWRSQWPRIMANTIAACVKHGARLVFFDNVYSYGLVRGPMTEETPFNPCSKKGEVRAQINATLLEAMRRGEITALIARAPDFYGPGATNSFTHLMIFERVRKRKSPQWLGDPRVRHDFIFTPDAGRATAALGQRLDAFGQTWHLPVTADGITGEALCHLACRAAGTPSG